MAIGRRVGIGVGVLILLAILGAVLAKRFWRPKLDPALAAKVTEISGGLERARAPESAASVRTACDRPKDPCDCVAFAARLGLDANLGASVLELLGKAEERCKERPPLSGMKAEALARVQRFEEARHQAEIAFRTTPSDMYSNLALGLAAFDKLNLKEAERPAQSALQAGRGSEAHRLLGRIALARGQFENAREQFMAVLAEHPLDAEAAFTSAMCSANLGRYNEAREAFVRVLRIDPKHVEARVHLAVLGLRIGARMEAEHHIRELEKIAPNDPRLGQLEEALQGRAPPAASSTPTP